MADGIIKDYHTNWQWMTKEVLKERRESYKRIPIPLSEEECERLTVKFLMNNVRSSNRRA